MMTPLNHNLTLNLNPFAPGRGREGIKSKITIKIKNLWTRSSQTP